MHAAGVSKDFEKQIAIANTHCSEFFRIMKHDKEQALLLPPYEFEVQLCCVRRTCNIICQKPFTVSLQRLQPYSSVCKVPVKHKYGAVVLCKVLVKFSGAEGLRLLSCTFTLTGENARAGLMTAGDAEPILLMHLMPDAAYTKNTEVLLLLQISMGKFCTLR